MEKKELLSDIIAAQLKSLMLQADLTIEGLSEAAGLSTHTIAKILKGQTRVSPTTVEKLTGLFGISASALMSSDPIELAKQGHSDTLEEFFESNEAT